MNFYFVYLFGEASLSLCDSSMPPATYVDINRIYDFLLYEPFL